MKSAVFVCLKVKSRDSIHLNHVSFSMHAHKYVTSNCRFTRYNCRFACYNCRFARYKCRRQFNYRFARYKWRRQLKLSIRLL